MRATTQFNRMRLCRGGGMLVLIVLACWPVMAPLGAEKARAAVTETEFKIAVLSKILPYVTWPNTAFGNSNEPLVFGVVGPDPFDGMLEQLLQTQKVAGREIRVRYFPSADAVERCQVLYVPQAQLEQWQAAVQRLSFHGLLTIGESEQFTASGGVFYLSSKEKKLTVNLKNAKNARLEINSKLLKIAQVDK